MKIIDQQNLIIGMVGLIGAGKDTAADYLCNFHGFRRDSFAATLKDAVSAVFGWDRVLLEGRTRAAREWREQVDPWWAERLNIPNLTPRWILQYWGTEVCRQHFHDDIWIASLENKLRSSQDNIVVSDVRFPNEISAIKRAGGLVIRIKRGPDPEWYKDAELANTATDPIIKKFSQEKLAKLGIHSSETSWVGLDIDVVIENNSTIDSLYACIANLIKNPELNPPGANGHHLYVEFSDN